MSWINEMWRKGPTYINIVKLRNQVKRPNQHLQKPRDQLATQK
jgi:hypothetical protein